MPLFIALFLRIRLPSSISIAPAAHDKPPISAPKKVVTITKTPDVISAPKLSKIEQSKYMLIGLGAVNEANYLENEIKKLKKKKFAQKYLAITIACVVLGIVFILYLSGLFFERIGNDLILYLLACTAVIGNIIYPQWLFQGLEQLKHVSFIQILSRILLFLTLDLYMLTML